MYSERLMMTFLRVDTITPNLELMPLLILLEPQVFSSPENFKQQSPLVLAPEVILSLPVGVYIHISNSLSGRV